MRRLLLVTHRSVDQAGGPAARWRSMTRYLPELGWEVDVVASPDKAGSAEFSGEQPDQRRVQRRARVMGGVGRVITPVFALAGLRPDAFPPSMAWAPRAAAQIRRSFDGERPPDVILATGPPMAALLAGRLAARAGSPPLVVEMRDLWAGNPAFDRSGHVLGAIERWVFRRAAAIIATTPEAVSDLRTRHAHATERIHEVPNGFESQLIERRAAREQTHGPISIMHSGTLTRHRPLRPLLAALARSPSPFRLVLQGYTSPETSREIDDFKDRVDIEIKPPSGWGEAIEEIAAADATLVTQARSAGDTTAVAAKVYEYLALGKPVLATTDGGATEALLRRLGVDGLTARLDQPASIDRALARLAAGDVPAPPSPEQLRRYERHGLAGEMARLLESIANR